MADSTKEKSRQEFLKGLLSPNPAGSAPLPDPKPASAAASSSSHAAISQPSSAATLPRSQPSAASSQRAKVRAELCPHCGAAVVKPEIAIVCQDCNRFVVPLRFWHGAIAVALILAAATLQATSGQPAIPVGIGLATSQLLLLFAVRPLDRHVLLIVISFLLIPASVAIVSVVVGFEDALPSFVRTSPAWLSVLALLALSAELFIHWRRAGEQQGLSLWRILGTFSIATSAGALVLVVALGSIPEALIPPGGPFWRLVQHMLRFRAGAMLVWLAYVVLLAMPATFARSIEVKRGPDHGLIVHWMLYVMSLIRGVITNLGRALQEGAHDILLLARMAIVPIGRRVLFLTSVVAWQVAFSLLIDSYLSYLVARESHALQIIPALLLAVTAPLSIFWTATRAPLADVLSVATRTVTLTGLLLTLCAAVASFLWWAYELLANRNVGTNWIGVASIVIIIVAIVAGLIWRGRP